MNSSSKSKTEFVLGIETSCDDTSAAVVDRSGIIRAHKTLSQYDIHAPYGGIYPELASRAHIKKIMPIIDDVIKKSAIKPMDLTAIGVTRGPGLIGSLLVGIATAEALSLAWNLPLYGVNHLRGHIRSVELDNKTITFPALVLLVSGGHTLLAYLPNRQRIDLLGATRDDSVGEAYDKVARMLGLPMPGGQAIDKQACFGQAIYDFPKPMINKNNYDFSFSGLKSSVARFINDNPQAAKENIACSFVVACIDTLMQKTRLAIQSYKPHSLVIVGGVAASKQLRHAAKIVCQKENIALVLPDIQWSRDNAAMIALATWDYVGDVNPKPIVPCPNLDICTY